MFFKSEKKNNKKVHAAVFTSKGRRVSAGKTTLQSQNAMGKSTKGSLVLGFVAFAWGGLAGALLTAEINPPGPSCRNELCPLVPRLQ